MQATLSRFSLALTATTTALMAGLFYAYSCSVNPGLARLPDAAYVAAMQSINAAIQNPVFFTGFMGTLLLLPVSTYLQYIQPRSSRFSLLLTATLLYVSGVFGVTILGNVPLNEMLAGFDLKTASSADIANIRARFEAPWNTWHLLRTCCSILALILVISACLVPQRSAEFIPPDSH